jgi:hypothetical protein
MIHIYIPAVFWLVLVVTLLGLLRPCRLFVLILGLLLFASDPKKARKNVGSCAYSYNPSAAAWPPALKSTVDLYYILRMQLPSLFV